MARRWTRVAVVVWVALAATIAGCSEKVVVGCGASAAACDDGGADGAPTCPALGTSGVAACDECRAASCCAEAEVCAAKPRCSAWLACASGCAPGDTTCWQDCIGQYPAADEKAALLACHARACESECDPGQCGGFGYAFDPAVCQACSHASCCDEERACAQDASCQRWLDCAASCANDYPGCLERCAFRDTVAGALAEAPRQACSSRACPECNMQGCGSWVFTGQHCGDCNVQSCCSQWKACGDDVECRSHSYCTQRCFDFQDTPECYHDCDARYPRGVGLNHLTQLCLRLTCADDCGIRLVDRWTCGGLPYADDPCKACSDAQCCAAATACGTNADCAAASVCIRACAGDAVCEATCQEDVPPAAQELVQAIRSCLADSCGASCG